MLTFPRNKYSSFSFFHNEVTCALACTMACIPHVNLTSQLYQWTQMDIIYALHIRSNHPLYLDPTHTGILLALWQFPWWFWRRFFFPALIISQQHIPPLGHNSLGNTHNHVIHLELVLYSNGALHPARSWLTDDSPLFKLSRVHSTQLTRSSSPGLTEQYGESPLL